MRITQFQVNPFAENVYVLWNEASRHCIIVDPGMMSQRERDTVTGFIGEKRLLVQQVVATHCHIDHVASARWTANLYGVPLAASPLDAKLAQQLPAQASRFHLKLNVEPMHIDTALHEGDVMPLDDETVEVHETPGHTQGGLMFHIPAQEMAIVGDTIFQGSVGRTDLGGDMRQLLHSVQHVILTLPPQTVLMSGHGPATTVANELRYNPYAHINDIDTP